MKSQWRRKELVTICSEFALFCTFFSIGSVAAKKNFAKGSMCSSLLICALRPAPKPEDKVLQGASSSFSYYYRHSGLMAFANPIGIFSSSTWRNNVVLPSNIIWNSFVLKFNNKLKNTTFFFKIYTIYKLFLVFIVYSNFTLKINDIKSMNCFILLWKTIDDNILHMHLLLNFFTHLINWLKSIMIEKKNIDIATTSS